MTRIPSTVVITGNGLHGMAGTSLTLHVPSEGLPRIESMLLMPTSVNVSEHSSHTPAETGISGPPSDRCVSRPCAESQRYAHAIGGLAGHSEISARA